MVLVYHVILQNHMTNESTNFMGGSCLKEATILPNLVVIVTVVLEIEWI